MIQDSDKSTLQITDQSLTQPILIHALTTTTSLQVESPQLRKWAVTLQ